MRCALCGRSLTTPTVMIGSEAIGPVCARKAGLTKLARKTGSRVLRFGRPTAQEVRDTRTIDLFEDLIGE